MATSTIEKVLTPSENLIYIAGAPTQTIQSVLETYWESSIPWDNHPHSCSVYGAGGSLFGFLSHYQEGHYGAGILVRYDGGCYVAALNNGTVNLYQLH